jgi:hypothetical protein
MVSCLVTSVCRKTWVASQIDADLSCSIHAGEPGKARPTETSRIPRGLMHGLVTVSSLAAWAVFFPRPPQHARPSNNWLCAPSCSRSCVPQSHDLVMTAVDTSDISCHHADARMLTLPRK